MLDEQFKPNSMIIYGLLARYDGKLFLILGYLPSSQTWWSSSQCGFS